VEKEKGKTVFWLKSGVSRLPDCQLFEIHAGESEQSLHRRFGFAP
jgi:hypothetical protein